MTKKQPFPYFANSNITTELAETPNITHNSEFILEIHLESRHCKSLKPFPALKQKEN